MADKTVYLSGTIMWAKVHDPDTKYNADGVYVVDMYLDDQSQAVFDKLGLGLKERTNDEGKIFYKFKRPHVGQKYGEPVTFGRPKVILADGSEFDGKIGNGSVVTLKLEVYDTRKGPAHRLEAIRVEELVPFEDGATVSPDDTIPF